MYSDRDDEDDDLGLSSPEHPAEIWLFSYADLLTVLSVFFILMIAASNPSSMEFERLKNAVQGQPSDSRTITEVREALQKTVDQHHLTDQVKIQEDDKTLAISLPGKLLFELGASELRLEHKPLLTEFAAALKELPDHARLAIEGHTDDNPVAEGKMRSNWHLSALRAIAVLEHLDQHYACRNKCEVRGFGEYRPKVANRDPTGAAIAQNQAENRRVVIRVF